MHIGRRVDSFFGVQHWNDRMVAGTAVEMVRIDAEVRAHML